MNPRMFISTPASAASTSSRPLQFGMDDEHCFQLRFYSPRALKNVTFWARIDGYEEEFKFMSLEKIMPFQQLRVHIPFATKDLTAYTRSGKKIRIMANPYLTEENLTFTVECDDPYWTRLQSIRCKWYIAFGRYSDTQDSWKYKMKASHTREAVAIALNMAYMFSSERFKTALYEFGPLHSNNDKAEIDKTALLANVLNHRGLTFGYTTGVMGLGGGTTFGMHEVCYLEHYADDKKHHRNHIPRVCPLCGLRPCGKHDLRTDGPGMDHPCATTYMWRCRWTRSCPSIPAASCTPAGAGTVILMIYTWLRNTLSKTRNSMRWTVACLPLRGETDRGGNDGGAGGVQAGLYRLARRYGNHLPPQGCICVRRYPVCRERCGQPVQRRGVRPCRRRQEALGKHQGMEARRSYREIRRPPERYHPCQRQDLCHPRRKPYRDFLMRRAISSLPA